MSRKCKFFASFICLLLSLVLFTGCSQLNETPEQIAKTAADQAAQEVLGKLIWGEADRTAITSDVTFITSNKNYPGVSIEWSSSEEDLISNTGKVTRPSYNDERAVMVGENKVVKVVITAKVTATYSWGPEGAEKTATTEAISKQFNFSVLTLADGIDSGTIKAVKARAWDYIYVQQGVDKALVSNSNVVYNVQLKGKVTAKLQASGATKGFFMHDGTEGIYVYGDNSANIGDTVEVIGEIYSYYGNLQVGSNITVNVIADEGYELPEHQATTPQQWEDKTKGLGDDVIGRLGGDLLKVSGYLTEKTPTAGSDKYCLVDAETGEESWLYYKAYTAEMEEVLKSYVGKYVDLYGVSYDRDSRIQKNEICWTGEIVETEAPKVDDATRVQVALSQINLEESYKEDFDLSAAGVWEVVSGTGIEIVEGVAKVTQGDADQEVVLKVTVTIGEATASKEFTVVVKGIVKETVKHAGTKEDPYSVSDALLVAGELAVGGLTDTVYAIGQIVSIKELSTSYGNATFNISDGKNEIIVYRAKFLNNEKFTSEDQIKVGDVVVICGQLTNYNGTLEFNSGCYVDSFGELVEEGPFKVNTPYYFALEQANLGKTLYLTGAMNGYYYGVTENTAEAAQVVVEQAEGGYNLKVVKVDGSVVYMDIILNGTYVNVVFVEAPTTPFAYNEEFDTFTKEVDGKVRYIGTYGTYTTMSPSTIDKAATSFVAHLYEIKQGEQPEPKHEHVACPECGLCVAEDCDGAEAEKCPGHEVVAPTTGLKEGQAYRFTLVQPKAGKTVYFTGKMSSYYYATSTDIDAGVDVFVEFVEGGLNLYFVDADGAKHYMGMVVSGTHINAVFDQDKTVFTYNEELQTVVGLVDGKEYVFGTRNDNTYTTIGANALSYAPFMVTFVPVGEPAPHEHNFVEGKCECGEVDPNYVPPHVHEECPECGKCLAEDCDGEKCEGHEEKPVVSGGRADLETMTPAATGGLNTGGTGQYVSLTSNNGWSMVNSALLVGGSADSNPVFTFIGEDNTTKAVTINGKVGASGVLTSPTLNGGISKLTFNYGHAFSDKNGVNITITITDVANGNTIELTLVKSGSEVVQKTAYVAEFVLENPISGDFTIEFTNNSPTNSSSGNKDRVSLWNIVWEGAAAETPHVHEGGKATCTKLAVCAECGEEYGELAAHVWDDRGYSYNDEKHWVDCVVCQVAKNDEVEHDFSNGNCVCGKVAPHVHEACPECGLCLAEDCEGEKCEGHVAGPKEVTIAEALKAADGTQVIIAAKVKSVDTEWSTQYNNMSVTLEDATGTLYVFRLATKVALLDEVIVTGTMATYYESRQIAQGATAEIVKVHEHTYTNGQCECGTKDPNYVPEVTVSYELLTSCNFDSYASNTTAKSNVTENGITFTTNSVNKMYTDNTPGSVSLKFNNSSSSNAGFEAKGFTSAISKITFKAATWNSAVTLTIVGKTADGTTISKTVQVANTAKAFAAEEFVVEFETPVVSFTLAASKRAFVDDIAFYVIAPQNEQ